MINSDRFFQRGTAHLILILILLIGLVTAVYLVQTKTNFLPKAASDLFTKPSPNRPPLTPLVSGPVETSVNQATKFTFNSFDFDGQKALNIYWLAIGTMLDEMRKPNAEAILNNKLDALKSAGVDVIHVDLYWLELATDSSPADPNDIERGWDQAKVAMIKNALKQIVDKGFLLDIEIQPAGIMPKWYTDANPDIDFVSDVGKSVRTHYKEVNPESLGPSSAINVIEYPSYWNPKTKPLLYRLWKKFSDDFINDPSLKDHIAFSYLGVGQMGEPYYIGAIMNFADMSKSDTRFYYWAYDTFAQAKFRQDMKDQYKNDLVSANKTWGTNFANWDLVKPPKPGEFTPNYWKDFLLWYRNEKIFFTIWAMDTYSKLSDRPFLIAGMYDLLKPEGWVMGMNNKGIVDPNLKDDTGVTVGVSLQRMMDTSLLLPSAEKYRALSEAACLPDRNMYTSKLVSQTWSGQDQYNPGRKYNLVITAEPCTASTNPKDSAEVVKEFGLDGLRLLPNPNDFDTNGNPGSNFENVKNAFQTVKNYRNLLIYNDKVKYIVDWGDGKTENSNNVIPGLPFEMSHKWEKEGTYQVKVKAVDSKGAESFWSNSVIIKVKAGIVPFVTGSITPITKIVTPTIKPTATPTPTPTATPTPSPTPTPTPTPSPTPTPTPQPKPSLQSASPESLTTTATSGNFRVYGDGALNANAVWFGAWMFEGGNQVGLNWYSGTYQGGRWVGQIDLSKHTGLGTIYVRACPTNNTYPAIDASLCKDTSFIRN